MLKRTLVVGVAVVLIAMASTPAATAQLPEPEDLVGVVEDTLCDLELTVVTDTLDIACPGPIEGTLEESSSPFGNANAHRWAFSAAEGDDFFFEVDNVDTAADIWACISHEADGPCIPGTTSDDHMDCTNMSGSNWGCPSLSGVLPAGDGTYYLTIGAWSEFFSGPFPHDYVGILEINGEAVSATQV